jgi:N-acetyl-1-D-myo-inositol-2-amino-2-deoxy-alpha-D-glucopyranoside deacetylase
VTVPRALIFVGAHPDDESFGVGGTLAQYAAAGIRVYYVCGTRGEVGEVPPEMMEGFDSIAELRTHELKCAADILGLADVIYLGYRDSGMPGTEDNKHPQALAAAPLDEVVGRIVAQFRRLKPQVVITSTPSAGTTTPTTWRFITPPSGLSSPPVTRSSTPKPVPPLAPRSSISSFFPAD